MEEAFSKGQWGRWGQQKGVTALGVPLSSTGSVGPLVCLVTYANTSRRVSQVP